VKISLVQAPRWSIHTPSYAIALLTGVLRSHGFTVFPKDFDVVFHRAVSAEDQCYWLDAHSAFWNDDTTVAGLIARYDAVVEDLVTDILRDRPEVVGFSVKIWSCRFSIELARRIRRRAPQVRVIFGGPQTQLWDATVFLSEHPEVDALCRQEADLSFPHFLKAMAANGGTMQPEAGFAFRGADGCVVDAGLLQDIPEPADIPFADYSDFDFSNYQNPRAITMLLSRGCINRCSFCTEAASFLRFRPYPAERVFAEIRHHAQRAGKRQPLHLFLNDSLLNGNIPQLERLADLLIAHRHEFQVTWGGMMFVREQMTDDLIAKLVQAGLTNVLFGLESGSPVVLARMRKPFRLETAERVLTSCRRHHLQVTVAVIFGHPGETEAEFHTSLNFLRANAHNVDQFLLSYLGLYGDCDIQRHPERYQVDPVTTQLGAYWLGDGGQNTFAIRNERVNLARLALGEKVGDNGGFFNGARTLYDPFQPYRKRLAQQARELDAVRELFRQSIRVRKFVTSRADQACGYFDNLQMENGQLIAHGWARAPDGSPQPAAGVILMDGVGAVLAYVPVNVERPDVAAAFKDEKLTRTGWRHVFPPDNLPSGRLTIRAFAYEAATGEATRLVGEFST
jgi:hypothetical protein